MLFFTSQFYYVSEHRHTNHLIYETSPYLLQHAHNPVEWYAWNDIALQKAREENKPVLVSIGYAACHWCHVMERESFENEETAALMNQHFINIKIDREERPDLDHVYMDAVQAISGGGGWPLNVFLLPDGRPFYGGTYYPPVRAFNRMSWTELLASIHDMFTNKRNEVESQADNLLHHLSSASGFLQSEAVTDQDFSADNLERINQNILRAADTQWGGFGNAPKFPQTFSIQYLLRQYYYTGHEDSVKQALLSLDKMIYGGIYDQLGGGFSRYSTDEKWLAPHFEKMLYDNALLISAISEAYQITRKEIYAETIRNTLEFIRREMTSHEGGWYSALDADSEGVEGKYYTWSIKETEDILGEEDSRLFCHLFDVSDAGNWEATNILWQPRNKENESVLSDKKIKTRIDNCKKKLLAARQKRIRPQTDDKIILGWNALMITACCKAFAALGDEAYLKMAEDNIMFLQNNFYGEEKKVWYHNWKNDKAGHSGFLDDYAYLIWAYIQLQEVTGNADYLLRARKTTDYVLAHFTNGASALFYYTPDYQSDVIIKKTEMYDGATPSGNATMAMALHYLSLVFDEPDWKLRAQKMMRTIFPVLLKYPTSFGVWAIGCQEMAHSINEIIITGENAAEQLHNLQKNFIANKMVQTSDSIPKNNSFALLKNRFVAGKTLLFVCKEGICRQPVENAEEALMLLEQRDFKHEK